MKYCCIKLRTLKYITYFIVIGLCCVSNQRLGLVFVTEIGEETDSDENVGNLTVEATAIFPTLEHYVDNSGKAIIPISVMEKQIQTRVSNKITRGMYRKLRKLKYITHFLP